MWLSETYARWLRWVADEQRNLRSMSVLRIIYGIGLLFAFVPSIPDRALLWGHASFWVDPEAKRSGYVTFDLLMPKDNPVLFDLAFFGMVLLAVLFTLGVRTRIVTPLLLLLLVSWQSNNLFVLNGGDTLYRITLLFLVFANLSEHYSVDAWLGRRRASSGRRPRRFLPGHVGNAAHNVGLVLCCFQIIVVYVVSGIWKLSGDEWSAGTALYYALRIDVFAAYPAINELLWQSTLLVTLATWIALWSQTLFPIALLWRPSRILVLALLIFMHLGIAVLLGLWPFSLAMIALDMLFIRDSTWVKIGEWAPVVKAKEFVRAALRQAQGPGAEAQGPGGAQGSGASAQGSGAATLS